VVAAGQEKLDSKKERGGCIIRPARVVRASGSSSVVVIVVVFVGIRRRKLPLSVHRPERRREKQSPQRLPHKAARVFARTSDVNAKGQTGVRRPKCTISAEFIARAVRKRGGAFSQKDPPAMTSSLRAWRQDNVSELNVPH